MIPLNQQDIALLMIASLFLLGITTFLLGVFVLVGRALGNNISTLAAQTRKLAEKGIVEDMAGLVGNAATLMDAIQQLVRTTAGIGIFLSATGLLMMAASFWVLTQNNGWPYL